MQGLDPTGSQRSGAALSMSWLSPSSKSRGTMSCSHSSLMRLAHSARHHPHAPLLGSRNHGAALAPLLASVSPSRSLDDLITDAIQESIDVRASLSSDHSSRASSACLELPSKLYAIMSNPEYDGAVSWMPHGYAWKIKDLNLFASKVLPLFIDGRTYPENFNNFVRLLTSFGFKQVTRGPDTSAYFHEMFLRGIPHLLPFIRPVHSESSRARYDMRSEPDFHSFVPLPKDNVSPAHPWLRNGGNPSRSAAVDFLHQLLGNRATTPTALPAGESHLLPAPLRAVQSAPTEPVLGRYEMSDLRTLQHLHQVRLECLERAQQVAETSTLAPQTLDLVAKLTKDSSDRTTLPKVQAGPHTTEKAKPSPKKKRTRRKWLPPLGPPSAATVHPNGSSAWFTNPEVFATLSEGASPAGYPPSNK